MTRRKRKSSIWPKFGWIISLVLLLLLAYLWSQDVSPRNMFAFLSSDKNELTVDTIPFSKPELMTKIRTRDRFIDSLEQIISILQGQQTYRKAIVEIEGTTLNMRALPSLSGNVLIQIPDSSVIDIMYFDKKKYVIDGKYGQWCKIHYADQEGWVWGNYLLVQDAIPSM